MLSPGWRAALIGFVMVVWGISVLATVWAVLINLLLAFLDPGDFLSLIEDRRKARRRLRFLLPVLAVQVFLILSAIASSIDSDMGSR